jgi:predicted transcriptional regulator of viral defense system
MARTAVGVPPALARRADRVVKPADAAEIYAYPRVEFARLAKLGALKRLATGYYALVPANRIGDDRWKPELEAAALGIAKADYGTTDVALMGVSAARHHGAIPRALGVAVVAVPKQRPVIQTEVGRVVFVKRDVRKLDVERIETELGPGWVTTVEQTLLDLAARPELGGLARADVDQAIKALRAKADERLLEDLAKAQRKPGALRAIKER